MRANPLQLGAHWLFGLLGIGLVFLLFSKIQGKMIGNLKGHLPGALQ
jgi:hypothetical protein